MSGLTWAVLLLGVALALLVLELFIPSGGLLGLLCGAGIVASIVMVFRESATYGTLYLVGLAILLPLLLVSMVRYWPHTAIGRMMLNIPPPGTEAPSSAIQNPLEELVGKIGQAKSKMLPSGAIVIDGRTYDAFSGGFAVEAGDTVEVIRVEGNRIMVRPVDDHPTSNVSSNPLDRPIDEAIPDPFDDPLS
jgi:membrane-bound serine protease (ClpP class)